MNPQDSDGERIVARMSAIRAASHHHVEELHHEANRLVDWREYVRAKPALAVAVAAGVGFMLTVGWRRKKVTEVIIARTVAPQSQTNTPETTGARQRSSGIRAGVMSMIGSMAGSLVRQYAMRELQNLMNQQSRSSVAPPSQTPSEPPRKPTTKRF